MQQKFTIDKQEYQSVFRVIDKDNQGFITVDQVNHYIEQFDQLHNDCATKRLTESEVKPPLKHEKNIPSYMRNKHMVNGVVKRHKPSNKDIIGQGLATQDQA
jgi:hypothetical protein